MKKNKYETDEDTCKDCFYFWELKKERDGNVSGVCRYNPPVPVAVGVQIKAVYPHIGGDLWCGGFKMKQRITEQ